MAGVRLLPASPGSKVSRLGTSVKSEFNAAKDDVSRSPALGPDLTDMSAGGLCSRANYAGACAEAGASFRHLGTGTAVDWLSPSKAALSRIFDTRAAQFWDKGRLVSHSMGEHDRRSVV